MCMSCSGKFESPKSMERIVLQPRRCRIRRKSGVETVRCHSKRCTSGAEIVCMQGTARIQGRRLAA